MKIMDTELNRNYWIKIAKRNGISRECFNARVNRGYSVRQAATQPLQQHCRSRLGKTNPNSNRQQSLAAGLSEFALTGYRRENPGCTLSDAQAIALIKQRQTKRRNPISAKAKAAGISPATVYRRMRRLGWPLNKALNTPPISPRDAARIGGKARRQKAALNNARTL